MKDRIRYFDIAKGLAILCVIAGHLGIKGINSVVFTLIHADRMGGERCEGLLF